MNIQTFVYKKFLGSRGAKRLFWSLVRTQLIRILNDPECVMTVHNKPLFLPLSHALPIYFHTFQFYDRLPERIAKFIRSKYGFLKLIDVGANIGDTIAAFIYDSNDQDRFMAIEPHKKFVSYLRKNYKDAKNVIIEEIVCAQFSNNQNYKVLEESGNAQFVHAAQGNAISTKSLDDIADSKPDFADFNILKIDTEGHDLQVIAGSKKYIRMNMPVVLFECLPFSNQTYAEDLLSTFQFFKEVGYSRFLFYNNFGNLMGCIALSDLEPFFRLLFFQLTSTHGCFDILLLRDEDITPFLAGEIAHFIDKMPSKELQQTARTAATFFGQ